MYNMKVGIKKTYRIETERDTNGYFIVPSVPEIPEVYWNMYVRDRDIMWEEDNDN
jgi:hypothetical protein